MASSESPNSSYPSPLASSSSASPTGQPQSFFAWLRERQEGQSGEARGAKVEGKAPRKGFFSWLREREEDESIWQCSWDVPSASSRKPKKNLENDAILIFDLGAYNLRAHVAERRGEDEEQSCVLPSCVRRPWSGDGGYMSGVERGAVQNWEEVEEALVDTFENVMPIGISNAYAEGVKRILSCTSSLRSPSHFARLGEIVFELLGAEQFLNVDQDLLSALAICGCSAPSASLAGEARGEDPVPEAALRLCQQMQNFTGVIVDLGAMTSRISPLLSGLSVSGVAIELPLGGIDLDRVVQDDLLQQLARAKAKDGEGGAAF
ncbi:actin-like family protein [Besnoitia besnoiti]|uniref:Actin-like family protein n=1 Tax=Besnoitia besnoiti TaxID=94643 RepID=A0A2A9MK60_BESBE|nr:actin-like family protein [Besnoitia besnoiti]PFH35792.1 actin-like family protein [Besnoitia besnoiti]